jgi:hypothetical protein
MRLPNVKAASHETDMGRFFADARKAEFSKHRCFRPAYARVNPMRAAAYLAQCGSRLYLGGLALSVIAVVVSRMCATTLPLSNKGHPETAVQRGHRKHHQPQRGCALSSNKL